MKWESNGNLLGFVDNKIIKIYSTKNNKIIFELEFSGRIIDINYEFINQQNIIINGEEKINYLNINLLIQKIQK